MCIHMAAGRGERYKRERRNKKKRGRTDKEREANVQVQARWVLVMEESVDEKKAQRETQTEKEEYISSTY